LPDQVDQFSSHAADWGGSAKKPMSVLYFLMLSSLLEQGRKLVSPRTSSTAPSKSGPIRVSGIVRKGRRTKDLIKTLRPGDIAVVDHVDMDAVAAWGLAEKKISALVNAGLPTSGRYPNRGPIVLASEKIPVYYLPEAGSFDRISEGHLVEISNDGCLSQPTGLRLPIEYWSPERIREESEKARGNLGAELEKFTANTLGYIKEERALLLEPVSVPPLKGVRKIAGRHAAVVVRGEGYKDDLNSIAGYLQDHRPILIGVDGGADALMSFGFKPDIILGDMDSVSDKALKCGACLVVHAYANGSAPGLERVHSLGLSAEVFPVAGTSEDAALILAYEKHAELIVAVGTHSTLESFLDKGRAGMSSTFLVRLKVGSRMVDARGVSQLHQGRVNGMELLALVLASFFVVGVLVTQSQLGANVLEEARLFWRVMFR
jgi:uncharacterized membrane-anchored protein